MAISVKNLQSIPENSEVAKKTSTDPLCHVAQRAMKLRGNKSTAIQRIERQHIHQLVVKLHYKVLSSSPLRRHACTIVDMKMGEDNELEPDGDNIFFKSFISDGDLSEYGDEYEADKLVDHLAIDLEFIMEAGNW